MEVLLKKLTYQEFREMEFPDDDPFFYELINGELVKKTSEGIRHQTISANIEFALNSYARKNKAGKMLHAPLDVVLDDNNAYQPDIIFVKKDRFFILNEAEQIVISAPDLVVEILSPRSGIHDRGTKKDVYEKYGVREYWIVDQRANTVEVYAYSEQRYKLVALLEQNEVLKSVVLEDFELDLVEVFQN